MCKSNVSPPAFNDEKYAQHTPSIKLVLGILD